MKDFEDLRKDAMETDIVSYVQMEIVGKLMAERLVQKMSQRELSLKSGVAQKTISRMESGIDLPTIDTLAKLSFALGLEIIVKPREEDK